MEVKANQQHVYLFLFGYNIHNVVYNKKKLLITKLNIFKV